MCAGLELEEFALERGEVDCEGRVGWGAGGEGLGEKVVVGLRGGGLGGGLCVEGLFAGFWG